MGHYAMFKTLIIAVVASKRTVKKMATTLEVETKYCNRCKHKTRCYKPCPVVLAALWDLPCEQELLKDFEENKNRRADNDSD